MNDPHDTLTLLDPDALAESLNGFDEIAIEGRFGISFWKAAQDPGKAMRMLLFTQFRRDGQKDTDAYRSVMMLPAGEVIARFREGEADPDTDDLEDAQPPGSE